MNKKEYNKQYYESKKLQTKCLNEQNDLFDDFKNNNFSSNNVQTESNNVQTDSAIDSEIMSLNLTKQKHKRRAQLRTSGP